MRNFIIIMALTATNLIFAQSAEEKAKAQKLFEDLKNELPYEIPAKMDKYGQIIGEDDRFYYYDGNVVYRHPGETSYQATYFYATGLADNNKIYVSKEIGWHLDYKYVIDDFKDRQEPDSDCANSDMTTWVFKDGLFYLHSVEGPRLLEQGYVSVRRSTSINRYVCAKKVLGVLRWGVIDKTGKEVVPFVYTKMEELTFDRIPATKSDRAGYLDANGNVILPFIYTEAASLFKSVDAPEPIYRVKKQGCGRYYFISYDGSESRGGCEGKKEENQKLANDVAEEKSATGAGSYNFVFKETVSKWGDNTYIASSNGCNVTISIDVDNSKDVFKVTTCKGTTFYWWNDNSYSLYRAPTESAAQFGFNFSKKLGKANSEQIAFEAILRDNLGVDDISVTK